MQTLWIALAAGFVAGILISAVVAWILFHELRMSLRDLREGSREWRCLYEATRREIDALDPEGYTHAHHMTGTHHYERTNPATTDKP